MYVVCDFLNRYGTLCKGSMTDSAARQAICQLAGLDLSPEDLSSQYGATVTINGQKITPTHGAYAQKISLLGWYLWDAMSHHPNRVITGSNKDSLKLKDIRRGETAPHFTTSVWPNLISSCCLLRGASGAQCSQMQHEMV